MASLRRTSSTSPAFPRCSRTSSGWLLLAATSLLLILPIDASGQTRVVHEEGFSTIKEARQLETHYKELIDRVRPAVVGLEVIYPGRGRRSSIAGGSGTIIDLSEGLILTSGHVGRASWLAQPPQAHRSQI